ncbi:substrate-binding domain-containing protein [Aquibacillus sediminis]|uniref:substrate-binding domain-containing protein n=1 Tax=Aquibacillus sediminis TaxID=2574734 RepID=UPI0011082334|nr:substrate-binding domain-containing protein [Aquibacillus sediminis]
MEIIKKFSVLLLLGVLSIFLIACGEEEETSNNGNETNDSETFTLGVTHYSMQNEFPVLVSDAQERIADEQGAEIEFYDGDYDPATQLSQFENMISQGVDAIIFSPTDAEAMAGAVEMADNANIPVFGVNTKVESDLLTSYIGSNDVEAGEIEMQWMADELDGEGNIVILEGPLGSSPQIQRKEGIYNILENYPDINVLAEQTGNWSRSEGLSLMENWLQAFPDEIDGVVSQNDEMALGAINALEDAGIKDDVPVVGVDAISDALDAVDEGRLNATTFQNAVKQGEESVEVALKYLKGESVEEEYMIPFELVTPDNLDEFK